jgi:sorbitol-specific phosphotransferase system component IIBC
VKGMLFVVVGVCLVSLALALYAIPPNKRVAFPTTVPTNKSALADFAPVSVRLSRGTTGHVTTVALTRGGQATTPSRGLA